MRKWFFRWLRYQASWWRWALSEAFPAGDPSLGRTRAERNRNIGLMSARWSSKEPQHPDVTAILDALRERPAQSALDLTRASGIPTFAIYPTLYRLERKGAVSSEWEDSPYPRRRRYSVPAETDK